MIVLLLHRLSNAIQYHRQRRATIKALSQLNDHLLRDVGIEREDIARVAATPPHRHGRAKSTFKPRHDPRSKTLATTLSRS
jgi:uncharacterized protein YjiS (DUF1127 family)